MPPEDRPASDPRAYLLDTNHCSRLLRGDVAVTERLASLGDAHVALCVITRGELVFMAGKSDRSTENLLLVQQFTSAITSYPVDDEVADVYGELKASIVNTFGPRERAKRRNITTERLGFSENNLWIAAVARRHNLTLVSEDGDFQRLVQITDLVVES